MSKARKTRTKSTVRKELDGARAKLSRLEKRIARLNGLKARLSEAANISERNRALLQESIDEWVAEFQEANSSSDAEFESLNIDFLLLDEAQNMKNLWPVGRREGGVPKYLGAISEGSDRAMAFAIRAFLTQRETAGSGVALLSATPAKNSPLEFFTLLGFVDHYCYARRNILDPEYFIDRYLRLELRTVLKPDGSVESRTAVVGFKLLNELRDIVFRYGDFKDARDVGLKLPDSRQDRAFLPMNEEQKRKYAAYRREYEDIVTSRDAVRERHRALGILQKMALVALHPELDDPPLIKSALGKSLKRQWTWANAAKVRNPESPKLNHAVSLILQKPDCGHIVFCDNVAIHRWLRGLLIAAGINPSRIAVLNADQAKTSLARQEIAEGFNGVPAVISPTTGQIEQEAIPAKYDIVIANAVAYEGIDLQVRTCRVIHLDLPFEPATLQQRNGRAVRQGSLESVIEIIYLLSEKSYDAIKLGMITGKLRWMSDILKGADRETNNPAAGMEMTTEDLLLMLADDPEAAKVAMEEVRRRNELERRKKAESNAWQRLADLLSYIRSVERREDELEKEQARKQVVASVEYLRAVPDDIWPWQFLIDKAMAGVPMATVSVHVAADGESEPNTLTSRAVWDGLYLPVAQSGVFFAVLGGGVVCVRERGDFRWSRPTSLPKGIANVLGLTPPEVLGSQEAPPDDVQWRESLQSAVQELRWTYGSGLDSLRLHQAPNPWRELVWRDYGAEIVSRLGMRGFEFPVQSEDTLELRPGVPAESVIPPTDQGWADFLLRAQQGRFTYTEMTEIARKWWGREFPRGIADERPIATLTNSSGTPQRVRLASGVTEGYAVADLGHQAEGLGSRRWSVAHIPSGVLLPVDFRSLDLARLGMRALASLRSEKDQMSLDPDKLKLLRWIAEQSEHPTSNQVVDRFRLMTGAAAAPVTFSAL